MTAQQAADRLERTLAYIRERAPAISKVQILKYEAAVQGVIAALLARLPTVDRAEDLDGMLAALDELLDNIRALLVAYSAVSIRQLLQEIQQQFQDVHEALYREAGKDPTRVVPLFTTLSADTERRLVVLGGRRDSLTDIASRGVEAARNAGADWLRTAVGVGLGITAFRELLKFMARDSIEAPAWAPSPSETAGARGLLSRGRQVLATETLNTMREGTAIGAEQSPIMELLHWGLSPIHAFLPSSPDACDVLADTDVGFGPGWYLARSYPAAPHPFCACFADQTTVIPLALWP